MNKQQKRVMIGEHELVFETGQMARQAGGAVRLQVGDTVVFSTACRASSESVDLDFLPLRVDYVEKFSSAGKTLGGFIKREGRPTERETLVARLIDRPLRPMFTDGYFYETQVLNYVFSYDGDNKPDVLAICASAAALSLSDIPLVKPVAAVRVGMLDGEFVLNPTTAQLAESKLDLVMAGTEDAVLMIEGFCDFLPEEQLLDALEHGHGAIKQICHALADWQKELGKPKITELRQSPEGIHEAVESEVKSKLQAALKIGQKQERQEAVSQVKEELFASLCPDENPKYSRHDVKLTFKSIQSQLMRRAILDEGIRSDGRKTTDIRPITIEQGAMPRTHGSSLFTRGETQALCVCTLGGETMGQRYEDLHGQGLQRFYLQYAFPPFSVGEVGRMGPVGRREVGHGKLAERAITPALPDKESFPYILRLESTILESNGSSSMASICGGILAMMDGGVPITRPVSGIAMGLILEEGRHTILSDILGVEDALGDMDFKVAGDDKGITAFQMDIKVEGITHDIMAAALAQAREGRIHILGEMHKACPTPRAEMSAYAPRIETLKVHTSKIGAIIGPGGSQIRAITEETGVEINIEDDGTVTLASPDLEGLEKAMDIIQSLTAEVEVGKTYDGKVVAIKPFGAFVEVIPGKEGLCHISELAHERVENIEGHLKQGERLKVKVLEINERGQLRLSHKATLEKATA